MAVSRQLLAAFALVALFSSASAQLLGAQPDGGIYITPEVINNCGSLPGTALDNSGNAMILGGTGQVTNIKEEGTDLGDCCPEPFKGTPVVRDACLHALAAVLFFFGGESPRLCVGIANTGNFWQCSAV
jgi:hypothetical protein